MQYQLTFRKGQVCGESETAHAFVVIPNAEVVQCNRYDLYGIRAKSRKQATVSCDAARRVGAEGVTRHPSTRQGMRARRGFTNRVASSAGREEAGYGFASNPRYELNQKTTLVGIPSMDSRLGSTTSVIPPPKLWWLGRFPSLGRRRGVSSCGRDRHARLNPGYSCWFADQAGERSSLKCQQQ